MVTPPPVKLPDAGWVELDAAAVQSAHESMADMGIDGLVPVAQKIGMEQVAHLDEEGLQRYMKEAVTVSNDSPVLLDRFLDDAVEMDVDAMPLVRIPGATISAGVAVAFDTPVRDDVRGWIGLRWSN